MPLKQDEYTLGEKFRIFFPIIDEVTEFLIYLLDVKNNIIITKPLIKLALNIPRIIAPHLSIIDLGSILNRIKNASLTNLKAIIITAVKNIREITSADSAESVITELIVSEILL